MNVWPVTVRTAKLLPQGAVVVNHAGRHAWDGCDRLQHAGALDQAVLCPEGWEGGTSVEGAVLPSSRLPPSLHPAPKYLSDARRRNLTKRSASLSPIVTGS